VGGRARFHVPIEPEMFTRTPRFLEYIVNDPLRLEKVTARFLLASLGLDREIRARIHELPVPVLLLLAKHDRIIDNERTLELLGRLPAGRLRHHVYERATHSIQFEETDRLVRDIDRFLEEVPC
jgi:acylglycerol lipase